MANAVQTFVPQVSADVPWHTRQHIQLLYQKLNNHAQAFANIANTANGQVTNNITEVNEGGVSGGGGGAFPYPGLGGVNNQTGNTSYITQSIDNGALIVFNSPSSSTLTLNSALTSPYFIFVSNEGVGVLTLTATTGSIVGPSTLALNQSAIVFFDSINWEVAGSPIPPQTFITATHQWLKSYDASTGLFAATQPAFSDIAGTLINSQLPTSGLTVIITTAPLTVGGTQGSQTFTNGILTAQVPAT